MKNIKNNFRYLVLNHPPNENRSITKIEMAEKMHITRTTFYKWFNDEANRYDEKVIIKICNYFNIPLSELLEYYPEDKSEQPLES